MNHGVWSCLHMTLYDPEIIFLLRLRDIMAWRRKFPLRCEILASIERIEVNKSGIYELCHELLRANEGRVHCLHSIDENPLRRRTQLIRD
jgi:hypothetical protein